MFRRAHQIADEVFIDAARIVDITPTQYSVLFSLNVHDTLDLASIARLTRLDRTTVTLVINILMERRLVERRKSRVDLRKYEIRTTLAGREIFRQCNLLVQGSIDTLLQPFSQQERKMLQELMNKFINYFESKSQ
jgi:DNA-binding MarR family transcriptional regulator